ncbi:MAG: hypothetical protein GY847_13240 [Proteobacteria bacterium]|nr:hypothetical protein [Pseudomonadota bacterium]
MICPLIWMDRAARARLVNGRKHTYLFIGTTSATRECPRKVSVRPFRGVRCVVANGARERCVAPRLVGSYCCPWF